MDIKSFRKSKDIRSIIDLQAEVDKVYYDMDQGALPLLVATIQANRLNLEPIWLMLVAGSSGGKTEMISMFDEMPNIHSISDLTTNSFASGFKAAHGKSASLLHHIGPQGIISFKDFTSILQKSQEARQEIMKQLREIYDGSYVKHTGTGETVTWKGNIGAIAGSTEAIYNYTADMSSMGERFIMYTMHAPDRREVALRAMDNAPHIKYARTHLKECTKAFMDRIKNRVDPGALQLSNDLKSELIDVADFSAKARSGVIKNYKGEILYVPSPEMPMRIMGQLISIGTSFVYVNQASDVHKSHACWDNWITEEESKVIYQCAWHSVPRTRRDPLVQMTKWTQGVTTAGLAVSMNIPTNAAANILTELNSLKLCKRTKNVVANTDVYVIKPEYAEVIRKMEPIETRNKVLQGDADATEAAWQSNNAAVNLDDFDDPKYGLSSPIKVDDFDDKI